MGMTSSEPMFYLLTNVPRVWKFFPTQEFTCISVGHIILVIVAVLTGTTKLKITCCNCVQQWAPTYLLTQILIEILQAVPSYMAIKQIIQNCIYIIIEIKLWKQELKNIIVKGNPWEYVLNPHWRNFVLHHTEHRGCSGLSAITAFGEVGGENVLIFSKQRHAVFLRGMHYVKTFHHWLLN